MKQLRLSANDASAVRLLILLIVTTILFSFVIDNPVSYQGDETFYIYAPMRMLDTGDFLVAQYLKDTVHPPFYAERERFQKPILWYWIVASFYKLLGVRIWVARLPSLLSMLGIMVLLWIAGKRLYNRDRVGELAALIYAGMFLTFEYSRVAMIDSANNLFMSAGFYGFLEVYLGMIKKEKHQRTIVLLSWISLGISGALKGPVGPLYAVGVFPLFALFTKGKNRWKHLLRLISIPGFLSMVLLMLGWYLVLLTTPYRDPLLGWLTHEESGRLRATYETLLHHIWWYPMVFLRYCFPWSVPALIILFSRKIKKQYLSDTRNLFTLYSVFFGFVMLFTVYLISNKPNYLVYLTFVFSLALAAALEKLHSARVFTQKIWSSILAVGVWGAAAGGLFAGLIIAVILSAAGRALIPWNISITPLLIVFLIIPIPITIAFVQLRKKKAYETLLAIGITYIMLPTLMYGIVFPIIKPDPEISLARAARTIFSEQADAQFAMINLNHVRWSWITAEANKRPDAAYYPYQMAQADAFLEEKKNDETNWLVIATSRGVKNPISNPPLPWFGGYKNTIPDTWQPPPSWHILREEKTWQYSVDTADILDWLKGKGDEKKLFMTYYLLENNHKYR